MKRRYGKRAKARKHGKATQNCKREHLVCMCHDELVEEEGYAIPELIGKEIVM
jgi:hypothetical protein